ncbi:uncharacterized protein C11orf42 homolog [Python bivittatus]|uniref:Uncharacterized protein C11orf42 homolog n=1 Tax=Python bivittatus TaxID=176946 RepID=A0A9F5N515_PYTBI|nr:uncharacterized protein C11orf42 homolog [Python bivittatus]
MDSGQTQSLEISEADANWELIRDKGRAGQGRPPPPDALSLWSPWQVIEERFGPTVIPVPFLEDAASYDLLTVLIKKPQLGQNLLRRRRCLVPIGPLEKLLPGGTATRELTHCTREYSARVRGESRYEETRLVDGALRHIRLSMAGVHKKVAFLVLRPGAVALRPDLPWLRSQSSIYVVYEVFYASSLSLAVTQGAEHRHFLQEQPLPVAFSCLKFALSHKGVLGSQKPMGHTLPARAAWVRMAVLEASPPARPLEPPLRKGPSGRGLPGSGRRGREQACPLGSPPSCPLPLATKGEGPPTPPLLQQLPTRMLRKSLRRASPRLSSAAGGGGPGHSWEGRPPGALGRCLPQRPPCPASPPGKGPFKQRRARLGPSCSSLADPERHSMSLPLLQGIVAESDTEE